MAQSPTRTRQARPDDPTREPVGIGSHLRKMHPWFEMLSFAVKNAAVIHRRKQERGKGPRLPAEALGALADELEHIQRQINPLETRRAEIVGMLLAHWGHTGIQEIESTAGKTLISTSFELCVDPRLIQRTLAVPDWRTLTAPILQAPLLLSSGKDRGDVRDAITGALAVRKLKVSVTAPSSRRPKSGELAAEEEER